MSTVDGEARGADWMVPGIAITEKDVRTTVVNGPCGPVPVIVLRMTTGEDWMLEDEGATEPDDPVLKGTIVDIITDVKRFPFALVAITVDEIVVGRPETPDDADACIEGALHHCLRHCEENLMKCLVPQCSTPFWNYLVMAVPRWMTWRSLNKYKHLKLWILNL
jgi:hypothetical protein